MSTTTRFLRHVVVAALVLGAVNAQIFAPRSPLNRTQAGRDVYFKDRASFRARKYMIWAEKWYYDAMKRIDKQIADDEDGGDGDDELHQFCQQGNSVQQAVCQTFGRESESCKVVSTEFKQKCVPGSGSDPFFFVWFCTQQIYAATELAPHDDVIFAKAAEMGLNLHRSPDGPVIFLQQFLGYMSRACLLSREHCKKFGTMLEKYDKENRIGNTRSSDDPMIDQQLRALRAMHSGKDAACCDRTAGKTSCCLVDMISTPLPPVNDIYETKGGQVCSSQDDAGCSAEAAAIAKVDYKALDSSDVTRALASFHSRAAWPTWLSTVNLGVPKAFHDKLTKLAVVKYEQFFKKSTGGRNGMTHLDVNNQFFNQQLKSEAELANADGRRWWPELYERSPEWRALFKYTKEACIQHVLRNGRGQTREYLEGLTLILWAAVYTTNTSHSTHMHEQSLCSGTYYSSAPDDSMPLILSDPRGGQPMHTDMAKPEAEPEAPFFHQITFFPKQGDMLLFPSYLPHSVPAATENSNPRVVWAYNLEGGLDSYARMSGVER